MTDQGIEWLVEGAPSSLPSSSRIPWTRRPYHHNNSFTHKTRVIAGLSNLCRGRELGSRSTIWRRWRRSLRFGRKFRSRLANIQPARLPGRASAIPDDVGIVEEMAPRHGDLLGHDWSIVARREVAVAANSPFYGSIASDSRVLSRDDPAGH